MWSITKRQANGFDDAVSAVLLYSAHRGLQRMLTDGRVSGRCVASRGESDTSRCSTPDVSIVMCRVYRK